METMAGRYRLILFDCDGTLVDSQHTIIAAMTKAWAQCALGVPAPEAVRRQVGLTLELAVARMLPDAPPALCVEVADAYRAIVRGMRAEAVLEEPLFPGIRALIETLTAPDLFLGIATGKNMRGLRHTLEVHGLSAHFHTLQTADLCASKPDPEMVERAMAETGVAPEETVVIGDTSFDMEMARRAGATPIGVDWGYHPPEELRAAGAVDILAHPGALLPLLRDRARAKMPS